MKSKTIKKKAEGILKLVPVLLSLAFPLAGIIDSCVFAVKSSNMRDDIINSYRQTAIFAKAQEEELSIISEKLEKGEISQAEYQKRKNNVNKDEFIEEVIKRNIIGNEAYQAKLDQVNENLYKSRVNVVGGVALLGAVGTMICFLSEKTNYKYLKSAFNDIKYKSPADITEQEVADENTLEDK